ncbi:MAG: hypothetical protein FWG02_07625 [Holophagaceae bacterium]|nr:hypothetical protein [Holophagaceae bacterium]
MAVKKNIKQKEIQIQKPAQSLTAFQRKVSSGSIDDNPYLLKRLLITGAVVIATLALMVFWNMWRNHKIEQHETALSALITEVEGRLSNPLPFEEKAQRMRNALPRLEEIAQKAPSNRKDVAEGLLFAWKLQLEDPSGSLPTPTDPWSRLRLAQRSIALGNAVEAQEILSVLHKDAKPNNAWSQIYWSALLRVRQLEGNREQALKDFAEYRKIFKGKADLREMEQVLNAI